MGEERWLPSKEGGMNGARNTQNPQSYVTEFSDRQDMGNNTKGDPATVTVDLRILPRSDVWAEASWAEMRTPTTATRLR